MERAVLFFFLFTASISDLKYRRIDNLLNIFFFASGILISFLKSGASGVADSIFAALAVFTFTYVLFAAKLMGAGDIKFIMALAAFTGYRVLLKSIVPASAFSIPIALISLLRTEKGERLKVPMAIPISLGVLSGL